VSLRAVFGRGGAGKALMSGERRLLLERRLARRWQVVLAAVAVTVFGASCGSGDEPKPRTSSGLYGDASDRGSAAAPRAAKNTTADCTYRPRQGRRAVRWKGVKALGWVVHASSKGKAPGDLYVSRADGSAKRRLTDDPRDEYSPSWAPDGSRVVFRVEAEEEGADADIWVVNADGSGRRNLTSTPRQAEWSPAWSPDGKWIAYFSANADGGNIYLMKPDGSAKSAVTRSNLPGSSEYPTWSPDGKWIAFISYGADGNIDISRIKADGSCRVTLTRDREQDTWPSWSPDGRRIAFVSDRGGSRELYTMRPDGSGVRRLTNTPKANENHPSWTVDGHIAFVRERGDLFKAGRWIVKPDGSSPRRLRGPGILFSQMSWNRSAGR
jgi:Tol biopolymer transport system component